MVNTLFLKNVEGKYNDIDYSRVDYINRNTHVKIVCKIHNLEYNQRPVDHYHYRGCPKCRSELKTKITFDYWKDECKKIYSNFYIYDDIENFVYNDVIEIICPEHGKFNTNSKNHYLGKGNCLKCVKHYKMSKEELLDTLYKVHNSKFRYSEIPDNWNNNTKIKAICENGHEFITLLGNHRKNKTGCPTCNSENGGWSKSSFMYFAKNRVCTFYIIRCKKDDEIFHKIGITSRSIKSRFKQKLAMPYEYEIINKIESTAEIIWNLEKIFLNKLKKYHYIPKEYFGGSLTECFKLEEIYYE